VVDSVKELVFQPWKFVQRRSFHLVAGVYVLTYVAANVTETVCSHQEVEAKYIKFLNTSLVNIGVGVAKVRFYYSFDNGDI
jgi:hypothetical protein